MQRIELLALHDETALVFEVNVRQTHVVFDGVPNETKQNTLLDEKMPQILQSLSMFIHQVQITNLNTQNPKKLNKGLRSLFVRRAASLSYKENVSKLQILSANVLIF